MAALRRPRLALLLGAILIVSSACVWVGPVIGDAVSPSFAGLQSATTCIPGPIAPGKTTSYQLSWQPAKDNVTPPDRIVYYVYQATVPGGEDFASPTYITPPGATSFTTPQLATDQQFFFVVRAVDESHNVDSNKVERMGQNLCL